MLKARLHGLRRRGISLLGLLQRLKRVLRRFLPSMALGRAGPPTLFNAIHY